MVSFEVSCLQRRKGVLHSVRCLYDVYKIKWEAECQLKKPDPLKVCLKTFQEIVPQRQQLFNWILTVETRIRFRGSHVIFVVKNWKNGISVSSSNLPFSCQLPFHKGSIFSDL